MKKLFAFGGKDLKFRPAEKIDTQVCVPPAIMVSTSGITLNQPLPGVTGTFVRFHHGDIKQCQDMNDAVSQKVALSGQVTDKSLKTPDYPNGEIENRTLAAILPHVPDDVYAFQIIKTESLKGTFLSKARTAEKADSQVFWLGHAEHIEEELVLRTVNGDCVALGKDDVVFNPHGVQVWPDTGVKARVAAATATGPHLTRVK